MNARLLVQPEYQTQILQALRSNNIFVVVRRRNYVEVESQRAGDARAIIAQIQDVHRVASPPTEARIRRGRVQATIQEETPEVDDLEPLRPYLGNHRVDTDTLFNKLTLKRQIVLAERRIKDLQEQERYLEGIVANNGIVMTQGALDLGPIDLTPVQETDAWAEARRLMQRRPMRKAQTDFIITRESAALSLAMSRYNREGMQAMVAGIEQQLRDIPEFEDPLLVLSVMLSRLNGFRRFYVHDSYGLVKLVGQTTDVVCDGINLGRYDVGLQVAPIGQVVDIRGGSYSYEGRYNHPHISLGRP